MPGRWQATSHALGKSCSLRGHDFPPTRGQCNGCGRSFWDSVEVERMQTLACRFPATGEGFFICSPYPRWLAGLCIARSVKSDSKPCKGKHGLTHTQRSSVQAHTREGRWLELDSSPPTCDVIFLQQTLACRLLGDGRGFFICPHSRRQLKTTLRRNSVWRRCV